MEKPELKLIKISETYIKFEFDYNEDNMFLIKEAYSKEIRYSEKEFFKTNEQYKISIEFEKGSLKTKIIAWSTGIYIGIANYGSFRSGIRQIISDARDFSEYVVDKFEHDQEINPSSIIRYEKRTGVPGRIQDIYNQIAKLERNLNNLSNVQIQTKLDKIKQDISNIIVLLSINESQTFISELDNRYSNNLPQPNEKKINFLINKYGLKPDDEIEFLEE